MTDNNGDTTTRVIRQAASQEQRTMTLCCCGLQEAVIYIFIFFFQAEDGIRDLTVTGVQTCAFPISPIQLAAERLRNKYSKNITHDRDHRDRKSVEEGKSVDLGGRRIIKKKRNN